MKKITRIVMIMALAFCQHLQAFVLMGPTDAAGVENTLAWPLPGGATSQAVNSANLVDDLGTPKKINEFYLFRGSYKITLILQTISWSHLKNSYIYFHCKYP